MSETNDSEKNVDRRHFFGMGMGIGIGSGLGLGYVMNAGGWLYAEEFGPGPGANSEDERDEPEVKCAVIGLGGQGDCRRNFQRCPRAGSARDGYCTL